MAKFEPALMLVLKHEGGYVFDAEDKGCATNHGISLAFYRKRVKVDAIPEDIRNLSIAQAEDIYKRYFWEPNQYYLLDSQEVANRIFDLTVNCGNAAIIMFQNAINETNPQADLEIDGLMGIKTIEAANACNAQKLLTNLIFEAKNHYLRIAKIGNNEKFLNGWLHRLQSA